MEDGSKGEAEDGFSWTAVLEVEKNPEEAHIANVFLALICEETEGKGVLDCAIKGLSEEDKKNITEEKSNKTFKFGGSEVRSSLNVLLFELK